MASALADDDLLAWTTLVGVRRFDPAEFIRSTDTLVLLSKDGEGSGGAKIEGTATATPVKPDRDGGAPRLTAT